MQKPFSTQPELFIIRANLEHASLQGLDGAEAILDEVDGTGPVKGFTGRSKPRA